MKLNDKISLGRLELDGRIAMPPMATYGMYKGVTDGRVTDEIIAYYAERAKNPNVALIETEHCYITKQGMAHASQISVADDGCIESLKKLTDAVHANGAKIICQLNHAGAAAPKDATGMEPVSASPVVLPVSPMMGDGGVPTELKKEDIPALLDCYVKAALRAKAAGYDGVEIHCAHAYFLNQFYSPLTNKRTDEYGGCLENRMRLLCEVIAAVRAAVGEDYTITVRLGACDYMEGGSTIDDAVEAAKLLEKAGIQMLSLSGGMCRFMRKGHTEAGYFADMSKAVTAAVNMPVLVSGGVKTLAEAQALLDDKAADLIGVGRALLADAAWEA